jgi:hypothetical protein
MSDEVRFIILSVILFAAWYFLPELGKAILFGSVVAAIAIGDEK